ncbi:hypothetical protein CMI37_37410 [Candidatus Pacearchaeota archaeon]|nr:hypothetical protein [Candidatus Pacearchaeota archaeon]
MTIDTKNVLPYMSDSDVEYFWSGIQKSDDLDACWEWSRALSSYGYGVLRIQDGTWTSHRIAYMLEYGDMPNGVYILHKCDNPPCCNPSHLELGSHSDNQHDLYHKNPDEVRGHAKLTLNQVREIRRRYTAAQGRRGIQVDLAREYKVTKNNIGRIIHNQTWVE